MSGSDCSYTTQGEGKHKELQGKTTGAAGKEEISVFPRWETVKEASLGRSRKPGEQHRHTAYLKTNAGSKNQVQVKRGTVQVGVMAVTGIGTTIQFLCSYTRAGIKGCWSNSFFKVNSGYV